MSEGPLYEKLKAIREQVMAKNLDANTPRAFDEIIDEAIDIGLGEAVTRNKITKEQADIVGYLAKTTYRKTRERL